MASNPQEDAQVQVDPIVLFEMGTRVKIVAGFFDGSVGKVVKTPVAADWVDYKSKWLEASGGEKYVDRSQEPCVDQYHVLISEDACWDGVRCARSTTVSFLEPSDLEVHSDYDYPY